jgi:hypothetical protein
MNRGPRRRGVGRNQRGYKGEIAGSPESPTAPGVAEPFAVESPDSTAAQSRGARDMSIGASRRRPRSKPRWPWQTIWTAAGVVVIVIGVIATSVWSVAWNAAGLKNLEDKHNTFAGRVAEDFKRVGEDFKRFQDSIDKRIDELLRDRRRGGEPPASSPGRP